MERRPPGRRRALLLAVALAGAAWPAAAQDVSLQWRSSTKVQQLIGGFDGTATDVDWQTRQPLRNATDTEYGVGGVDLGYSFLHRGRRVFLFGDTINFKAGDTVATSTSSDPEAGLALDFLTLPDHSTLTVQTSPFVDMGAFNVPNSGISLDDRMYVVLKTNHSDGDLTDVSLLTRFDEATNLFDVIRPLSDMSLGGKFIDTSLHLLPPGYGAEPGVLVFGLGQYRHSNVALSLVALPDFESGARTRYLTGLDPAGEPVWSFDEADAVPVVRDDPLGDGSAPTIGNVSVVYSGDLGLWLMTYDGGRQSPAMNGIYFSYARAPWGPWSTPQLIFNACRDGAFGPGGFIHYHYAAANGPDCGSLPNDSGPAGPTIDPAKSPPATTRGGGYAPYMMEDFTRVAGDTLTIYYTLSTWNPYTVVLMRSQFTISH